MQQGLRYADMLQVPFAFSSNSDGFLFHNNIAADGGDADLEEKSCRYLRSFRARWKFKRVDGFKIITQRARRLGRIKIVHKPEMKRSETRRFGDLL
jgi:hypothetical protein